MDKPLAVIVGVGDGLSASLARLLSGAGYGLVLVARDILKIEDLAAETDAKTVAMDATDPTAVRQLFDALPTAPRVVIYNPSSRVRGPIAELDPEEVRRAIDVTAYGAFLVGQAAAREMLKNQESVRGTILFTGASAGIKGFARSAAFAMGKFAQRGLAQAMARELHPRGIHVAWVNIDGGIRNAGRPERMDPEDKPDSMLCPDAIARAYLGLIEQDRSAWSDELTLRPWVESY